jgi:hypothetical protein
MEYFEVITDAGTGQQTTRPYTAAEIAAAIAASILTFGQQQAARAAAYRAEADPLYFKAQRGEATNDEWLAKVAEIKARFPYPND